MKVMNRLLTQEEVDTLYDQWSQEVSGDISKKLGNTFSQALTKAQAEISFKAGIQEVMEWVAQYRTEHHKFAPAPWISYHFEEEELQAKLKEWGIEHPSLERRI